MRQALAFGAQSFVSKSADAATIGKNILAVLSGDVVTQAGLILERDSGADQSALEIGQRMAQLTP